MAGDEYVQKQDGTVQCRQPMRYVAAAPLLIVGLLVLAACGSGKTVVMNAADQRYSYDTVTLVHEGSAVAVPEASIQIFETSLAEQLYGGMGFETGTDLTISYKFLVYDEGDQAARWLSGGIGDAGKGNLIIVATYLDATGASLSEIQAEGQIGMGAFGGSFDLAIKKAATEIANYTAANFRGGP